MLTRLSDLLAGPFGLVIYAALLVAAVAWAIWGH